MKHKLLLLVFIVISFCSFSQDIIINFQATGAVSTIDNVVIKNLTNGTSVFIQGDDYYNLSTSTIVTAINSPKDNASNQIYTYPNPTSGKTNVVFSLSNDEIVNISITNVSGKIIVSKEIQAHSGTNMLSFISPSAGMYFVNIYGEKFMYNTKFVSLCNSKQEINISYDGYNNTVNNNNPRKISTFSFNSGDLILLKVKSGNYIRIITDTPTVSKVYSSKFIEATDIDGNHYPVVTIGTQIWMAKNLFVTHYPNGDLIPFIIGDAAWALLVNNNIDDAYSYYYDNGTAEPAFGYFYTYAAAIADDWVKDNAPNQGICPNGWHLPTQAEWTTLRDNVGGTASGGKLKSIGTSFWNSPNAGATNSTGFSAYGAGRYYDSGGFGGSEYRVAHWWASTEYAISIAYCPFLRNDFSDFTLAVTHKSDGINVRCINNTIASISPKANFSTNKTQTTIGESMLFTDSSLYVPTSWVWNFGDGEVSTEQNPIHKYKTEGTYKVTLTVNNAEGSDVKINYITINKTH